MVRIARDMKISRLVTTGIKAILRLGKKCCPTMAPIRALVRDPAVDILIAKT